MCKYANWEWKYNKGYSIEFIREVIYICYSMKTLTIFILIYVLIQACSLRPAKQSLKTTDLGLQVTDSQFRDSSIVNSKNQADTSVKNTGFERYFTNQMEWREHGTQYQTQLEGIMYKSRDYWADSASIIVHNWDIGDGKRKLTWEYRDVYRHPRRECGMAFRYDLDSLIIQDINGDGYKDIAIAYTMDCVSEAVSTARYLVFLDYGGKVWLKVSGSSMDPYATNRESIPSDFVWNTLAEGEQANEGKILNYDAVDSLQPETRKRVLEIWKQALNRDIRMAKERE